MSTLTKRSIEMRRSAHLLSLVSAASLGYLLGSENTFGWMSTSRSLIADPPAAKAAPLGRSLDDAALILSKGGGVSGGRKELQHGYPSFDNVRTFHDFVLSYDQRLRGAKWVLEHLTADKITRSESGIDRANSRFQPDAAIHSYFQATLDDFRASGFDRGHLAAAENHCHKQLFMDETFILSNISPQVLQTYYTIGHHDLLKVLGNFC